MFCSRRKKEFDLGNMKTFNHKNQSVTHHPRNNCLSHKTKLLRTFSFSLLLLLPKNYFQDFQSFVGFDLSLDKELKTLHHSFQLLIDIPQLHDLLLRLKRFNKTKQD